MVITVGRTKKVNTYGKKKTQIITVHTDFTPAKSPAQLKAPSQPPPSPNSPLLTTHRPPLRTKLSQDVVQSRANIISTPDLHQPLKSPLLGPIKAATKSPSPFSPESIASAASPSSSGSVFSPAKSASSEEEVLVNRPPRLRKAKRIVSETSTFGVGSAIQSGPTAKGKRVASKTYAFESVELPIRKRVVSPSDLINQFAKITIETVEDDSFHTAPEPDTEEDIPLDELLKACSFNRVCPFTGFLRSGTFTSLLPSTSTTPVIRKIGEATFSEVFGVSCGEYQVVVKIIPLTGEKSSDAELPDPSSGRDVLREVEVTKHMTGLEGGGFVEFLGAFVVRGAYPLDLLEEWDRYDEEIGSESIRPGRFEMDQRYAMIVLADGGPDLEAFAFDRQLSWIQAAGIFWQITDALARAEKWAQFEHRDMHEGQVLISPAQIDPPSSTADLLAPSTSGCKVTIIDFGLSRLNMPERGSMWSDIPPDLYEGVGDQWDVYRLMRDHTDDEWTEFYPSTNIIWLRYILGYILRSKSLRKPRAANPVKSTSSPLQPARRVPSYSKPAKTKAASKKNGKEAMKERVEKAYDMLREVEVALNAGAKGKRGKKISSTVPFGSAGELMELAKSREWLSL